MASKGQRVEVQITSGRWSLAQISKVVDAETGVVNLVALTDGVDPWPTIDTPNGLVAGSLSNIEQGTGVGKWRELALPVFEQEAIAEIAAGSVSLVGYATSTYVDEEVDATGTAAAAYADGAAEARVAVPASCGYAVTGQTITMSARAPSSARGDDRATRVTAVVTWAAVITGTAAVEIVCDSNASPTTVVMSVPFAATLALGVGTTMPVVIDFEVPAGWSYKIRAASGGSGTTTLASLYERAL